MNTPFVVVQATRVGFLVVLWLFVFAALRVIRADLFGSNAPQLATVPARGKTRPTAPKRRGGRSPRQLLVVGGPLAGTAITLDDQTIMIGRADDSTLVLTDDYASSHHARLTQRDGDWYVEDLGSTNGTFLDKTKVTAPMPVAPGVPIRIGKTVLELRT